MDKQTLKTELTRVVRAFEQEGRQLEVVGIIAIYPDLPSTSYVLQVYAESLTKLPSCSDALSIVIDKLYEVLPQEALRYINRVEICDKQGDIHCISDDLITNLINFQPPVMPYSYIEA